MSTPAKDDIVIQTIARDINPTNGSHSVTVRVTFKGEGGEERTMLVLLSNEADSIYAETRVRSDLQRISSILSS